MTENGVRLGEGVADKLKQNVNLELIDIGKLLINVLSKYAKEKIQEINIDELINKKNEEDILNLWSTQLVEKGLISKGYAGLPDDLLMYNLHQEGYAEGLYVGYVLAMMSLVDNNAPKDLLLSVRDDIQLNLIGYRYKDRNEFFEAFKSEKYNWINRLSKEDITEH